MTALIAIGCVVAYLVIGYVFALPHMVRRSAQRRVQRWRAEQEERIDQSLWRLMRQPRPKIPDPPMERIWGSAAASWPFLLPMWGPWLLAAGAGSVFFAAAGHTARRAGSADFLGSDQRAREQAKRIADLERELGIGGDRREFQSWDVYPDEHYPVCACCHEPVPCRAAMAEREAERAGERLDRYSTPGVCAYCGEVVTARQKSITFDGDNLELPGGPPVSFHLRGKRYCVNGAIDYEKRWVAADPENRPWRLYCPGDVINHNDGTYECSRRAACPGPRVPHNNYQICDDEECRARGYFSCDPAPTAVLREEAL